METDNEEIVLILPELEDSGCDADDDISFDHLERTDAQPHRVSFNLPDDTNTKAKKIRSTRSVPKRKSVRKNSRKRKTPYPLESQEDVVDELKDKREELKLLTLKYAQLTSIPDEELKQQLNRIARMKENDLNFELEKARFRMDSSWTKNLAEVVKDGTAIALDTITKGNGFVQKEISEDKQLEGGIYSQIENYAFSMNPKIRIAVLAATDTIKGLMKKRREQPIPLEPPKLVRQNAQYFGVNELQSTESTTPKTNSDGK